MSKLLETIDRRNTERKFFTDLFANAGFTHVALNEIKNRYHNSYSAPPWFAVTTEQGFFIIGWRKRVISIQWHDIKLPKGHFDDLGNISHDDTYVHAWDVPKAVEYLTRIRENSTRIDSQSLNWPRSEGELKLARDDLKAALEAVPGSYMRSEFDKLLQESDY